MTYIVNFNCSFFETSDAKIPKLGTYYKLTLDKSISKPGTLPEISLVSPSYAGTTPKLVKAAKCSLPSYYRPVHALLFRFYLDFIMILSKFYPDKIRKFG